MAWVWYCPSSLCTQMRCESAVSLKHEPMASTCSLDLFKTFISLSEKKRTQDEDLSADDKYLQ